jgi:YggT family protein
LSAFIYLLILAVIIRSLLTWFPISRNNQYVRLLDYVTEPLLDPVRRVLPRTGMIDLSAMVVLLILFLALSVVRQVSAQ